MCAEKIAVVTDSSAYIPEEISKDLNIHVIPLWLIWDDQKYRDGMDIDPPSFYKQLVESKTMPTSSQPSAGEFAEFFKQVAIDNDVIVAVLVSSVLSGTFASALAAKEQLPEIPIHLVDTKNVSMALGFAVVEAAKAAAEGKPVADVIAAAESICCDVNFLFAVDTLEFLRKGGRIGAAKALLGSALSIKPILQFKDGAIEPLMQVRTKRKALQMMLDVAEERLAGKAMGFAAVVDAAAQEEGDAVAEMVKERFGVSDVVRAMVSPVVGTHAGPGSVGLIFCPAD
jgi:DegV family protein with EDD domain